MSSWFKKAFKPLSDKQRHLRNIRRWRQVQAKLQRLRELIPLAQSVAYSYLQNLINDRIIQANFDISSKLDFLLCGENNQKVILDSPARSQGVIDNILRLIDGKILDEQRELRGIEGLS